MEYKLSEQVGDMKTSIIVSVLFVVGLAYATDISNCSVLNVPNTAYKLTADIITPNVPWRCLDITASNITLDCNGYIMQGTGKQAANNYYGISAENVNNITIRNCKTSNWTTGIYLEGVSKSNLLNDSSNGSTFSGIELSNSSNNTIQNSEASSGRYGFFATSSSNYNTFLNIRSNNNTRDGIWFWSAYNNTVKNSTLTGNQVDGVTFRAGSGNVVTGSLISHNGAGVFFWCENASNPIACNGEEAAHNNLVTSSEISYNGYGMRIDNHADNNTIAGNRIFGNMQGIYMVGSYNQFYNNFFNNSNIWALQNVYFANPLAVEYWNTTKKSGIRIYSPGTQIGGNYWVGYSDNCTDSNRDGFCDKPYDVLNKKACTTNCSSNIDYFPLSSKYKKIGRWGW
jgi:parallel beta-helix repeat protein